MSPSRPLLIFLLLFLNPALGFPVAKRLSHSEISEDVLAGTDFLSVFMKTSPARSVAPSFKYSSIFGAKARNSDYSETNSVVQKSKEDIHLYSDINLKGEDALESDSHEAVDHQEPLEEETIKANSQVNTYIEDTMTVTDKNITDSTTSSPTTTAINDDTLASTYYDLEEEHPSIVQGFRDDRSTKPTVTQYWSETKPYSQPPTYSPVLTNSSDQAPLQVISVRVSSSVVRHSHKVDDALKGFESEKVNKPVVSTLVTQEQPTNTAIQRSHLNVEEATLPEDQSSYQHEDEPIVKIQPSLSISNTDSYQYSSLSNKPISSENNIPKVYNRETNQDENSRIVKNAPVDEHHSEAEDEERKIQQTDFLKLPQNQNQTRAQKESLGSYIKEETDERRNDYSVESTKSQNTQNEPQALPYQYKYRSYSHQPSPIPDYQSRSYLKEENYEKKEDFTEENPQPEVNRDQPQALAFQYNPQNHHLSPISYHTSVSSATSGSRVQFYRGPPSYRRGSVAESVQRAVLADPKSEFPYPGPTPPKPVHQPEPVEKSYELPEQNYEVDESISVVTNGRAHGVQIPTPIPTVESSKNEKDDENKSGYVVEGRNFRKYRVEERTSDGFIVGEYGVVSHDDGSLRGVRYTADGTINPRLIYDALVKFLSLK